VVAAAHDLVAVGGGASDAHRRGGGVGARLHEERLLAAGHDVDQAPLKLVLQRLHQAEAEALVHLRLGGVVDLGLYVAQDDRPIGAEHVDVVVAVDVDDMATVAVVDEDRVLADDEVVRSTDAHDPAGSDALGLVEHGQGPGEVQVRGALDVAGTHGDSFFGGCLDSMTPAAAAQPPALRRARRSER
jgi:hypothetical protein